VIAIFHLKDVPDVYWRFGLPLLLGITFAVIYSRVTRRRGLRLVEDWARLHQFTIISVRQPLIVPLWKTSSSFQWFRVALRDASGATRHCLFRCRDFIGSLDSVEVFWDEKPSA
jgi:hypothetical protein